MPPSLIVRVVGDTSALEKSFKRASTESNKFGGSVKRLDSTASASLNHLGRSFALVTGGLLGAAGLTAGLRAAFGEMADGQKVSTQTAATLKSTGFAAAHISAKQIDGLSQSLLNKSGIDDEAIKSGSNMLLTFTNIRNETGKGNDVFSQATKTLLDMTVALNQGDASAENLSKQAVQLGKALNDPVRGITALQRVGVTFTAQQKLQITALEKSGHTLEAQKLILHELNREFGGSAEALGKTLPGRINILRENVLNLGGSIAGILTPDIERVVDRADKWLANSKNQQKVLADVRSVVHTTSDAVHTAADAFDALSDAVGGAQNELKILGAGFAAYKLADIAGGLTGIGTNAEKSAGKVSALHTSLSKLALIGAIAIPIEILVNKGAIDKSVNAFLNKHGLPGGSKDIPLADLIQKLPELQRLGLANKVLADHPGPSFFTNPGASLKHLGVTVRTPGSAKQILAPVTLLQNQLKDRVEAAKALLPAAGGPSGPRLPAVVSGTGGPRAGELQAVARAGHRLDRGFGDLSHFRDTFKKAPKLQSFNLPANLELGIAKSQALGDTSGLTAALKRAKAATEKAIHSGTLGIDAVTDAYRELDSLNGQLKSSVVGDVTKFRHKGRFSFDTAIASKGKGARSQGQGGVTINVDTLNVGARSTRELADELVKQGQRRPSVRRGT